MALCLKAYKTVSHFFPQLNSTATIPLCYLEYRMMVVVGVLNLILPFWLIFYFISLHWWDVWENLQQMKRTLLLLIPAIWTNGYEQLFLESWKHMGSLTCPATSPTPSEIRVTTTGQTNHIHFEFCTTWLGPRDEPVFQPQKHGIQVCTL